LTVAPAIGILTSTHYGGAAGTLGKDFMDSFEAGFKGVSGGSAPTYTGDSPQEAKGQYDAEGGRKHKDLYRGVAKLNKSADIIVVVGGLAAAHSAVQKAQKPFLVLIGRIPEEGDFVLADNENYLGGVNLHTVQDNIARREYLLRDFSTTVKANKDVFLLYNPNSRMGKSELNEWTTWGGDAVAAATPGDNDPAEFNPAFTRLNTKGAKGVVISADPFFADQRTALVTAANNAFSQYGMIMCYPFELYKSANPTANSGVIIGPNLLDAYKAIGQKTANIASFLVANPSSTPTSQGLDSAAVVTTPLT
jgi:hypothetical protein